MKKNNLELNRIEYVDESISTLPKIKKPITNENVNLMSNTKLIKKINELIDENNRLIHYCELLKSQYNTSQRDGNVLANEVIRLKNIIDKYYINNGIICEDSRNNAYLDNND